MVNGKTKLRMSAVLGTGAVVLGLVGLSAPASAAGGGCANANSNLEGLSKSQAKNAFVCLFNQARDNSVSKNGDLGRAAQKHTDVMRDRECFSHQCSGEGDLEARVEQTGYPNGAFQVGELIAYGNDKSANDIVKKWLKSSDHRGLIKRGSFDDVGVGINVGNDVLVTAVFGTD